MCSIRIVVLFCIIFSSYGFNPFKETYTGLFRENDIIVAKDSFYRHRVAFKKVYGYYWKKVHCPITYLKVTDRLGIKPGPTSKIVKGGLQYDYVVLQISSVYNRPILVTVTIGCANNKNSSAESYEEY